MDEGNHDHDQLLRRFKNEKQLRLHLHEVCAEIDRCWYTPIPDSLDSKDWEHVQMYSGKFVEIHVLAWLKIVNDARLQTRLRERLKILDQYMPSEFRLGVKFEPRSVRSAYFGLIERYKSRLLTNGFYTDPICYPVEEKYYPNHDESPLKSQLKLKKYTAAFLACAQSFDDWQDLRESPVRTHTFQQRLKHLLQFQYQAIELGLFKDPKESIEMEELHSTFRDSFITSSIAAKINACLSGRPDDFKKWGEEFYRFISDGCPPELMEPKNINCIFFTGELRERIERECREKGFCKLDEKDLIDRSNGKTPNIFS